MRLPKIIGESVYIRQLQEKDFDEFIKTRENREFRIMCGASKNSKKPSIKTIRPKFEGTISQKTGLSFAIIRKEDNIYIGHCRLHAINKTDKNAKLAIGLLGDFFGKGYGPDAIDCLLKFGFNKLKLHKIYLDVLEFNKRAIKAYKKCGFKIEGKLRDNAYIDGKYYDDVRMSILDSKF